MESQNIQPGRPTDDSSCARLVAQHAQSIRQLHKRSIADIMEIGRLLNECRNLIGHGDWLPWLRREFAWSERTARNYITVYEALADKSANVADLSIDLSSLYLIAAPSTPPEASAEVIGRAGAGESLSPSEVRRIVLEAKQHQPTRRQSSISMKEVLDRTGLKVLNKLSNVENRLHFELAKHEGQEIALQWAEIRAGLKKKYRDLLLGLDFLEMASKPPMRKIIEAIPSERRAQTAERLRVMSEFLSELRAKLMQQ
jgi:Protein of unknown function (DUF3102)